MLGGDKSTPWITHQLHTQLNIHNCNTYCMYVHKLAILRIHISSDSPLRGPVGVVDEGGSVVVSREIVTSVQEEYAG